MILSLRDFGPLLRDSFLPLVHLNHTTVTHTQFDEEYFDNNVEMIRNTPWMVFPQYTLDELLQRSDSWDSNFEGRIIRVEDIESGVISEMYFTDTKSVNRVVNELIDDSHIISYDKELMYFHSTEPQTKEV